MYVIAKDCGIIHFLTDRTIFLYYYYYCSGKYLSHQNAEKDHLDESNTSKCIRF